MSDEHNKYVTSDPDVVRVDTYFCPKCDSPAVEVPELEGAIGHCRMCKFQGKRGDFFLYPIVTRSGNDMQTLMQQLADASREVVGKELSIGITRLLLMFGFLPWDTSGGRTIYSPNAEDRAYQSKILTTYLKNAAKAIVRSLFQSREEIEPIRIEWQRFRDDRDEKARQSKQGGNHLHVAR